MTKLQPPKYSWYKYHLTLKKYKNIHTRVEQSIEDGSFWEMSEKFQKALLRRLNILFKRLLRILKGVRLGTSAATVAFMILTGNINAQSLTQQTGSANPFNGFDVGSYSVPTFVDIDNDGDMDAYIGAYSNLRFFENVGTSSAPVFNNVATAKLKGADTPPANGGFSETLFSQQAPAFVDIDGDGDFDLKIGQVNGSTNNYLNSGSVTSPAFGVTCLNPLYTASYNNAAPAFVDIDNDGDFDAFVGNQGGTINYYKNYGTNSLVCFAFAGTGTTGNPLWGFNTTSYAKPAFVDFDDDGDFDVFVGNDQGMINYYKNNGTASSPLFGTVPATENPFNGITLGSHAAPTFVDINGDGSMDAFVGAEDGTITFFTGQLPTPPPPTPNQAPILVTNVGPTVDEASTVVLTNSMLSATDPDAAALSIRYYVQQGPSHGTLNKTAFTQNEINNGGISYTHNGDFSESDSFTFRLEDGEGGVSDIYTFDITINQINTAPVLTEIESTQLQYAPGSPQVAVSATLEVADQDNLDLVSAKVSVTNYVEGEDFLLFTDTGLITHVFDAATGMLSLTGTTTLANYQAALRNVEFINLGGFEALHTLKTISFTANDGVVDSDPVSRVVSIELPSGNAAGLNPPSNVRSTFNPDGTVTVTWEDNSGNEIGFIVYRQVVSSNKLGAINAFEEIGIVGADAQSFVDANVIEGVVYSYKVVAYNSEGIAGGDQGSEVEQTESLIPPDNLAAELNANEQIVLTWSDNSGLEDGYKIERDGGTGFVEIGEVGEGVTTYMDESATPGISYTYRVYAFNSTSKSVNSNTANASITGIEDFAGYTPVEFELSQNYPNPFNPTTTIRFALPNESHVAITVFNVLGQEMASLVNNVMTAGYHEVQFDAAKLTSGMYVYKIEAGSFVQIKKMILMK